jgi:hypothetical protein
VAAKKRRKNHKNNNSVFFASFWQKYPFFGFIFRFLVLAQNLDRYLKKSNCHLELLRIREQIWIERKRSIEFQSFER